MGDRVERLLEVHKAHIEWLLVLACLVHQQGPVHTFRLAVGLGMKRSCVSLVDPGDQAQLVE